MEAKIVGKRNSSLAPVIQALLSVYKNDFVRGSGLFHDELESVISRLEDDSFRIAVVGEFSSGKSTFVNALIGRDLLKHGAKETTATITEIQNTMTGERGECFDVLYADGKQETDVPLDALENYTTTSSNTHNVVQEITRVVIKAHVVDTSYPISFIDTPGLNGIADGHRDMTIAQVRNAHACLYLLQVRGLGQSDIEFIRFISKYQRTFIFIQNFIDELNELEGESPEAKVAAQKKLLSESVFNNIPDVNYTIIGISSRKALLARDKSITMDEGLSLTEQVKQKLLAESHFTDIISEINTLIQRNVSEQIQQRDALFAAKKILCYLKDIVLAKNERDLEEWRQTPEAQRAEKTKELLERFHQDEKKYQTNIENFLESEGNSLRIQCKKHIESKLNSLETSVYGKIDEIKELEDFDRYAKDAGGVSAELNCGVQYTELSFVNILNAGFENILDNALLRIKEYSGQSVRKGVEKAFDVGNIPVSEQSFKQDDSAIETLRKEVSQGRIAVQRIQREQKEASEEESLLDREMEEQRQVIRQKEHENDMAVQRMGSRPKEEIKEREEPYNYYRGGLGILDFLFGPKTGTRTVKYHDRTKQEAWDRKRAALDSKYKKECVELDAKLRLLQKRKDELQDKYSDLQEEERRNRQSLKDCENLLEKSQKELETKKKKAKRDYLANIKGKLKERVHGYLFEEENICGQIIDELGDMFDKGKKSLSTTVLRLYKESFAARIRQLEESIGTYDGEERKRAGKGFEELIDNTLNVVEETICQM